MVFMVFISGNFIGGFFRWKFPSVEIRKADFSRAGNFQQWKIL